MAYIKTFLTTILAVSALTQGAILPVSSESNERLAVRGESKNLPLPFPEFHYSELVAATQQTYCLSKQNIPGFKFADFNTLATIGTNQDDQRVNIYYSSNLDGIVVACSGTNPASLSGDLKNAVLFQVPPIGNYSIGPFTFNVKGDQLGLTGDARIHAGYFADYQSVWNQVKADLEHFIPQYPGKPIYVTGHSQGAGYGYFVALAIEKAFPGKVKEVIMFGIVRGGNEAFAKQFSSIFKGRYDGVVNGNDWVYASVPYPLYRHASPVTWISPANSTTYKTYANGDDPELLTRPIEVLYANYPNPIYWGDHQGYYMHSLMGGNTGAPCPAVVAGQPH